MKYLAEDGKVFDTAEKCMAYEREKEFDFYMFNSRGEETDDYENASFIYCPGAPDKLYDLVVKEYNEDFLANFGSTKETFFSGLYYYNEGRYHYFFPTEIDGLINLFTYLKEKSII